MTMQESKSERMQLLLKPTIKAGLKNAAQEKGISMNDLINKICEAYLEIIAGMTK